jgi:hypothetical protein
MRKLLVGFAVVLVACVALYVRFRTPSKPIELAYSGNRHSTLWSTSAQVREPIGTLSFGDRLEVLQRFEDQIKVKTATGQEGWIQERDLMTADVWETVKDLQTRAASLPAQAKGHTKVLTNLHIGPGRDTPRITQLGKAVQVDMLERRVPDVPSSSSVNADAESGEATPGAKKEDWWLVRIESPTESASAGWLLGRFVELDVPEPLPDYANSSGMRIVGWFELNKVNDAGGGLRSQYLLVGAHGADGQTCDFTLMRVYTFAAKRESYETAFIESDVCGKLPIHVDKASVPGGEAGFSFQNITTNGLEERKYRLIQTVVRRVNDGGEPAPRKHKR